MIQEIEQVIESAKGRHPDLRAEIKILNDQNPVKTQEDDPFVRLVQEVVKEAGGAEELGGMTGYTDSAQFALAKKTSRSSCSDPEIHRSPISRTSMWKSMNTWQASNCMRTSRRNS